MRKFLLLAFLFITAVAGSASVFAEQPLSQTQDPVVRRAMELVQKGMDISPHALDVDQDPGSRIKKSTPHFTNTKQVELLRTELESFFKSRYDAVILEADGNKVSKATQTVRLLTQENPEVEKAGRQLLTRLRNFLGADIQMVGNPTSYKEYYLKNRDLLEKRNPELKLIKTNGKYQALRTPLRESVPAALSNGAQFIKTNANVQNLKTAANYGGAIAAVAGGTAAYFFAEHLALCWYNDDPACMEVLGALAGTAQGMYQMTSYMVLMQSQRRFVNWGLPKLGARWGFAANDLLAFWLAYGTTTVINQPIKSAFDTTYAPRIRAINKEYKYLTHEIERLDKEIKAKKLNHAGPGDKKNESLADLEQQKLEYTKLQAKFLKEMSDWPHRYAVDLINRGKNWQGIAAQFMKTGFILSWMERAKLGNLSREAFSFENIKRAARERDLSGLKKFATAEGEDLVKVMADQAEGTHKIESRIFAKLSRTLDNSGWYSKLRKTIIQFDKIGIQTARLYGHGPIVLGKMGEAVIKFLVPKKLIAPMQAGYAIFYEKLGRYLADAAAFSMVYSALGSTWDAAVMGLRQMGLFPWLYPEMLGLEISTWTLDRIPVGRLEEIAGSLMEFNEDFNDISDLWDVYRNEVIRGPIDESLKKWESHVQARSHDYYRKRHYFSFFERTDKLAELEAIRSDEIFKQNGSDFGGVPWHLDPLDLPTLFKAERAKYRKLYDTEVRGKNVTLAAYLEGQDRIAHTKIEELQKEKIQEIGGRIERTYMNGWTLNPSSHLVDLLRSMKAHSFNWNLKHCEVPMVPGNLNSAYIEEIKYVRLLVLSWAQRYPAAMQSREFRDLFEGLSNSPCDFGPFRSRLRTSLENVADKMDPNEESVTAAMIAHWGKWSTIARIVGKRLLVLINNHELNRIQRDRLLDFTWNYTKKKGLLETLKPMAKATLLAQEEERQGFIGSMEAQGLQYYNKAPANPFRNTALVKEIKNAAVNFMKDGQDQAMLLIVKNASSKELLTGATDAALLEACKAADISAKDCLGEDAPSETTAGEAATSAPVTSPPAEGTKK